MHTPRPVDTTGTIGINEFGYTLIPEGGAPGGGEWTLGNSRKLAPWLGRHVHVRGTRADFSFLDVRHIEAIDGLPAPLPTGLWARIGAWWRGWRA